MRTVRCIGKWAVDAAGHEDSQESLAFAGGAVGVDHDCKSAVGIAGEDRQCGV